jgi:tetratricopeptide (TPR) repeat protein
MPPAPKVIRKDLKEDKVYLTMAGVADFFVRHRFHIAIGVLAALVLFALAYYHNLRSHQKVSEAALALYEAEKIRDPAERADALLKVNKGFGGTPSAALAGYQRADLLYEQGKYDDARQAFSDFLKRHPNHASALAAREALGYCYESLGQWKEAATHYENLWRSHSAAPVGKRITYRLGLCYERLGETAKAIEAYRKTLELLPDSLWADYAAERLASLGEKVDVPETAQPVE